MYVNHTIYLYVNYNMLLVLQLLQSLNRDN